jgi:hypothetical protein
VSLKIRITPLLILSALSILYALYFFVSNQHDEEGWGEFAAVILIVCGIAGILVYSIIRYVFNPKFVIQLMVELIILGILFLIVIK